MSYNSKYSGQQVENLLDSIGNKVDKVDGKQLSTEDFTTLLKQKLDGLSNYDDTEISQAIEQLRSDFDTLVSGDTTTAIKTFNEVIAFLEGISDTEDLASIIASIEQQIAAKQDKLVSGTNIKTINGESILGEGNIVIEGGGGSSSGSSGAYAEVNHGTSDTTFTLTPNTFHVWDEVASLDLSFGSETSGVANEYLFQFTSGATATTLTLPSDIKWANDSAPTIAENMIYQISVLKGLASVLEFSNAVDVVLINFKIISATYVAEENMTWEEWVNSEYNSANCTISGVNVYKGGFPIGINGVSVLKTDTIINNQIYMQINTGGSD